MMVGIVLPTWILELVVVLWFIRWLWLKHQTVFWYILLIAFLFFLSVIIFMYTTVVMLFLVAIYDSTLEL